MRKQKPLQANGWLATALLVGVTLASSAVTAANREHCALGSREKKSAACHSNSPSERQPARGGDDASFNLSRDYIVRLLNETIAGCEGQDIRNWKSGEQ